MPRTAKSASNDAPTVALGTAKSALRLEAAESTPALPLENAAPSQLESGKTIQVIPASTSMPPSTSTPKSSPTSSPSDVPSESAKTTTSLSESDIKATQSSIATESTVSSLTSSTLSATQKRPAPPVVPVRTNRQGGNYSNRSNGRQNRSNGSSNYNNNYHSYGKRQNQGNQSYQNYQQNQGYQQYDGPELANSPAAVAGSVTGVLDLSRDGHGVLRLELSGEHERDTYISTALIRRHQLRPGDVISGPVRIPKENERFWGLIKVETVNGLPVEEASKLERPRFKSLTPVYPNEKIKLEIGEEPLSLRIIDLVAPIGKGQRSLIVSPPKAGKTTLLKDISTGVAKNHPEIHIMAVLVGERPEEVTDIRRHIASITNNDGEVAASNFDESAEDQCRVAEVALEKAKRMVEMGKDVLILLDSITRLARAYNLAIPTSGRTLSGGFDPAALFPPKKFFGAARNFEVPGSLTIVGTALVETGSRMDDLIYEEFKGTGNQEVQMDRRLAERRIFPAIDVQRSGTRRDDLLMDSMTYQSIMTLQRMLDTLDKEERTAVLIEQLRRAKSNKEFLASLKVG